MHLTDTQKLLRVVHLKRIMEREGPDHPNRPCHAAEMDKLLSGVGLPPESLMRVVDPREWAAKFSEMFRHPEQSTVLAWFDGAQAAAYEAGRNIGALEGRARGQDDVQQLVNVLRLVQLLMSQKRITGGANILRDDNNPDAAPQTLAQHIDKALMPFDQ